MREPIKSNVPGPRKATVGIEKSEGNRKTLTRMTVRARDNVQKGIVVKNDENEKHNGIAIAGD